MQEQEHGYTSIASSPLYKQQPDLVPNDADINGISVNNNDKTTSKDNNYSGRQEE